MRPLLLDHRIDIAGRVRDEEGAPTSGITVTLRRQRLLYDTVLASSVTDGAGAYRVVHRLEGCAQLDAYSVVAERAVGADTVLVREEVACSDETQTVDLVVPTVVP